MAKTLQANQVADAIVAAPGITIEALRYVPGGDRDLDSGDTAFETLGTDEADEAEAEFEVPFTGTYRIVYRGAAFSVVAGDVSVEWQLLFDEAGFGGWTQQAISDTWKQFWVTFNEYLSWTYAEQTVYLEAGTHKVAIQGKHLSGSGTMRSNANTVHTVSLEYASGSGAGGTLLDSATKPSDQAVGTGADTKINDLDLAFTCSASENVAIVYEIHISHGGGTPTSVALMRIDGGSWEAINTETNAYLVSLTGVQYRVLDAGPHTVEFGIRLDVSGTVRGGGVTLTHPHYSKTAAVQFRGGLVPIQENAVTVTDTPAAINFVGDNVSVTNVGGKASINISGVTAPIIDAQPYCFIYDSPVLDADTNFATGARIHFKLPGIMRGIQFRTEETASRTFRGKLWNNTTEVASGTVGTSAKGVYDVFFTTAYEITEAMLGDTFYLSLFETAASTHYTFQSGSPPNAMGGRGWSYYDNIPHNYNAAGDSTYPAAAASVGRYPIDPIFELTGDPGGFVKPENVPVLEYSSASVVNITAAPGADSILRVLLNDGVRYTATAPLTVDMTASGLGGLDTGSEAADTWYYLYAVPGATEGSLGAVASVTDPDTGPTGYSAWRYLGAVRNDSSSNLYKWYQVGNRFINAAHVQLNTGTGTDATPQLLSMTPYIPDTAAIAHFGFYSNGNGSYSALELWADGDQAGSAQYILTGDGRQTSFVDLITKTSPKQIYYKRTNCLADIWWFNGWTDGYLRGAEEARAPSFSPDTNWRYLDAVNLPTGAAAPEAVWQAESLNDQTANSHDLTVTGGTVKYSALEGLKGWWSEDSYYLSAASPSGLVTTGAVTAVFLASFQREIGNSLLYVGGPNSETEANNVVFNLQVTTGYQFLSFHEYSTGSNESLTYDSGPCMGSVQHVAVTRSSDGLTHKLYVDGVLVDTQVATNAPSGGSTSIAALLCADNTGASPSFHGALFSALYTKEEWSAAQVLESYRFCRKLV